MRSQDNKNELLLDLLVKSGKMDKSRVAAVNEELKSGSALDDILAEKEKIDIEDIYKFKAQLLSVPYFNLLEKKVSDDALKIFSQEVAENYKIICLEASSEKISVGMVDPEDFKAVEAIEFLAKREGLSTQIFLISPAGFNKIIKQYSTLSAEVSTALQSKAEEDEEGRIKVSKKGEVELEEVIKSAPVAKIVSVIIKHAVEGRASDIHIEPMHKESRIRYRIDGVLHTSLLLPKSIHPAIIARIKVMANMKLDETRIPQDGRIDMNINGHDIDFRVSLIPLMRDEKVVMRILDVTRGAPTLEDLGFSHNILRVIKRNISSTNGMFLITGPTGSGKSTSLFALLNLLNKEGINISTLEDPVEYFLKGVNQSQVRPEVGYTFASGLRSLLRQDPDIIMVGEIRDSETAELAIHSSLTGHFVLSTLHTNNAMGAIPRLIDMNAEPFLLGSTLSAVVAQRLARMICPHCKIEAQLPENVRADIFKEMNKVPAKILEEVFGEFQQEKMVFSRGEGCPRCGNTGYNGRICIAEVIDINDQVRKIIIDKNKQLSMEDVIASQDFVSMYQDGLIKCLQGITTIEEVMRVVRS